MDVESAFYEIMIGFGRSAGRVHFKKMVNKWEKYFQTWKIFQFIKENRFEEKNIILCSSKRAWNLIVTNRKFSSGDFFLFNLPEFITVSIVELTRLALFTFLPISYIFITIGIRQCSGTVCKIIFPLALVKSKGK